MKEFAPGQAKYFLKEKEALIEKGEKNEHARFVSSKIVPILIMHLLRIAPDTRGMITGCDIRSSKNCGCSNVISRCLKKLSPKRVG